MPDSRIADIKSVFETHEEEIRLVEAHIRGMFQSDVFLIPLIGRHILESGGKRLRPLFLLSSARLAGYRGMDHIALAGIVESIHTASLLHDDVVDGADIRRGKATAHSVWGNQVVILAGDFLYSNALRHAVSFRSHRIMEALSEATTRMTEGELLQLHKSADLDITEAEYIDIIAAKTGILISAACRVGAILGGLEPLREEALASFGLKAGIAFQMADDILDYMADEGSLGKKLGKDLEEGKITLPLICLVREIRDAEKTEIKKIIEDGLSEDGLTRVLELFRRHKVFEQSIAKAKKLIEDAKAELLVFPSSSERDVMFTIADYALQRKK